MQVLRERLKASSGLGSARRSLPLGVDIGAEAVRLAQLGRMANGYRLLDYAVEPLPPEAVADDQIQDVAAVSATIAAALARMHRPPREAVSALADSQVTSRAMTVKGASSDLELEAQALTEAQQYIPYSVADAAVDFRPLPAGHPQEGNFEATLAICRQEHVDVQVAALAGGGLKVRGVDVAAAVLARVCGLLLPAWSGRRVADPPAEDEAALAIVELASGAMTLSIYDDGRIVYARQHDTGEQAARAAGGETGMAASPFADGGAAEPSFWQSSATAASPIPQPPGSVAEIGSETSFRLASVIAEAVQFFRSTTHYRGVALIGLAGSAAVLVDLPAAVEVAVGRPCVVASPLAGRGAVIAGDRRLDKAALAEHAPTLLRACGLALGDIP